MKNHVSIVSNQVSHQTSLSQALEVGSSNAVFKIRHAVESDISAIARVHHQSIQANFCDSENKNLTVRKLDQLELLWTAKFKSAEQVIGVLLRDEKIVGFASVGGCDEEIATGSAGKIFSLYLHPSVWGGGIGKLLMNWCEQALLARGYSACKLWVVDVNARAMRFYEKQGFALDGAICEEDTIVLRRMHKDILSKSA